MEKSGSEKTYPSRRRACYQSVTGSGRFLIDKIEIFKYQYRHKYTNGRKSILWYTGKQ
ncbi:MAG: hypothetical protein ACOCQG_03925 [Candidatus Nanoarchaeia archaeon]